MGNAVFLDGSCADVMEEGAVYQDVTSCVVGMAIRAFGVVARRRTKSIRVIGLK